MNSIFVCSISVSGLVIDFSGDGRGARRGADVCSCRPDYGVEWMVGEPSVVVCTESFERVTAGWGGGGRGGVESNDLKEPFPLKCVPTCTPANTITSLVGSAS